METYNKHYIRTSDQGYIVHGFSDAFQQPQGSDICINEQGGYQFRLEPGGEENPLLFGNEGEHLYKWDGESVIPTTPEEHAAELAAMPLPTSSPMEQLRADVDLLLIADLQREGIL